MLLDTDVRDGSRGAAWPTGVVHVTPTFFSPESLRGGGERYPTELASAMAKYCPTTLVSFGEQSRTARQDQLTYRIFRPLAYRDNNVANPIALRFVPSLLQHRVIHVHQVSTIVSNMSCLLGALPGYRVFITDHGGGGSDFRRFLPLRHCVRAHLSVSRYAGQHTPLACDRTIPIYGGVDATRFQPGVVPKHPYALFVGSVLPHKGIDVLIGALAEDHHLVIVGRPYRRRGLDVSHYYDELVRLAAGKQVRFVDDVSDAHLVDVYQRATVTVLPSVYDDLYGGHTDVPELLGLVLLESMACGTPVICSAVGGMPEIVKDQETGLVVPPNDPRALREALTSLLGDPDRAARMGMAARRHVLEHFTWDAVARRCLNAYAQ